MKPILELNAFDANSTSALEESLQARLRRRAKLFGAASVLFYDRPLEFVRGEGCWLYDARGVASWTPTTTCQRSVTAIPTSWRRHRDNLAYSTYTTAICIPASWIMRKRCSPPCPAPCPT